MSPTSPTDGHGVRGAYGLALSGLEPVSRYLVDAPDQWPELMIERTVGPCTVTRDVVEDDWAEYVSLVGAGCVRVERRPLSARYTAPGGYGDEAMIHPGLGLMSAIASRWLGREAFHSGAFVLEGGAWAVAGQQAAGKSSTLGQLASKGVGIVADDVLVVDDGHALAGPRCIDLRGDVAGWTGQGTDLGVVGARRRWRMRVPPVPAAVPLRGWIVPEWGDRVEIEPVAVRDRLAVLHANLAVTRVPSHPTRLMKLAALPFFVFRRPRRWEAMEAAVAALLDRLPR